MRRFHFGIKQKFILITDVILLVAFLLVAIVFYGILKNEVLEQWEKSNLKLVETYSELMDLKIKDKNNFDEYQTFIEELYKKDKYNYVVFMRKESDGVVYIKAHSNKKRVGEPCDDEGSILAGRDGKEFAGYFIDPDSKLLTLDVLTPIFSNRELKGALNIGIPVDEKSIYEVLKSSYSKISILLLIMILVSTIAVYFISHYIFSSIIEMKESFKNLHSSSANLKQRIELKSKDEIGSMTKHFNSFIDLLQKCINDVKNSENELVTKNNTLQEKVSDTNVSIENISESIDSVSNEMKNQFYVVNENLEAVNQISKKINSLKELIDNQVVGVSQASSAVEEMIGNISSVTYSAESMAESFEILIQEALKGVENQNEVIKMISEIENQSFSLKDANRAIADVANQTNLLAMNAAIEAAHAGEAGKGFSVVAEEIRKLSENSSVQSKKIGHELKKIIDSIELVVNVSKLSGKSFSDVSEKLTQTDQIVIQIKNAMEEQNEGSKQITDALALMNSTTSDVNVAYKDIQKENQIIISENEKLKDSTSNISKSIKAMNSNAYIIKTSGSVLKEISKEVESCINHISEQINRFES